MAIDYDSLDRFDRMMEDEHPGEKEATERRLQDWVSRFPEGTLYEDMEVMGLMEDLIYIAKAVLLVLLFGSILGACTYWVF